MIAVFSAPKATHKPIVAMTIVPAPVSAVEPAPTTISHSANSPIDTRVTRSAHSQPPA
jgi:hypothetical protein